MLTYRFLVFNYELKISHKALTLKLKNVMINNNNLLMAGDIMNMDHLKLFVNLAQTLNFSQTSKNMYVSQPAVTQAVNSIEKELGVILFKRTKRSVQLTSSGRLFFAKIQPLLTKYDNAVGETRALSDHEKSAITIDYTGTNYEANMYPKLMIKFNKIHPSVRVYLENHQHNMLKERLLHRDSDIAFITEDGGEYNHNFIFDELIEGTFVCVIPINNPLTKKNVIKVDDLKNETIILFEANQCPPKLTEIQTKVKKELPNATFMYSSSAVLSHTMIQAGLGVAIMPTFVTLNNQPDFKVLPMEMDATSKYGIAVLKDNTSDIINDFVNCAKAFFEDIDWK